MPISIEDVKRMMGPTPIIDPSIVLGEIARRYPMNGRELDGIKKDMTIQKVVQDILEQPQISGQSKWEDRFLFGKGDSVSAQELSSWMEKSRRGLDIPQGEHTKFFTWLKGFDACPWQIEDVDDLHKTIKFIDKDSGLMKSLTYGMAMNHLNKSFGWSNADVFEYWDWKKSMFADDLEAAFTEMVTPGGYRLQYGPSKGNGYVEVSKAILSNKSFIAPDMRGREVLVVMHKSLSGTETELGSFWGVDAPQRAYAMATDFANKMAKGCSFDKKKKKMEKSQILLDSAGLAKLMKGSDHDEGEYGHETTESSKLKAAERKKCGEEHGDEESDKEEACEKKLHANLGKSHNAMMARMLGKAWGKYGSRGNDPDPNPHISSGTRGGAYGDFNAADIEEDKGVKPHYGAWVYDKYKQYMRENPGSTIYDAIRAHRDPDRPRTMSDRSLNYAMESFRDMKDDQQKFRDEQQNLIDGDGTMGKAMGFSGTASAAKSSATPPTATKIPVATSAPAGAPGLAKSIARLNNAANLLKALMAPRGSKNLIRPNTFKRNGRG